MSRAVESWTGEDANSSSDPSVQTLDPELEAVNKCLAAATSALNFDIAELWRFGADSSRSSGLKLGGRDNNAVVPTCEHVYAGRATLKTYTGRILGIWSSGFEDSQASQEHVLSPKMCAQARASECPLWFKSTPTDKLHKDLPLNTAVVLPVHLEHDAAGEHEGDYVAVFLSLATLERNKLALDFLGHISKAATKRFVERRRRQTNLETIHEDFQDEFVAMNLRDVPVVLHSGERISTAVGWGELSDLDFLANGSRCTVYSATYRKQSVVVKLMRKDIQDAAAVRRELERELELLQRIRHENVIRLLGAGTEPERFLIISRLEGGTLAQRCKHTPRDKSHHYVKEGPFTYMELLRCARQLAEALRYLHEEAVPGFMVVHRDIKPDNIGFTREGDVKLLDLGLSRLVVKSDVVNATYRMTGETGSTRYMAPEVAESFPYNEKVDVYSYGLVLWTMCTLKKPFETMGRDEFYQKVVRGGTRPPVSRKWPRMLSDIMRSCWAVRMNDRPTFAKVSVPLLEMLQQGIDQNLPMTRPSKGGFMSNFGQKDRHTMWF